MGPSRSKQVQLGPNKSENLEKFAGASKNIVKTSKNCGRTFTKTFFTAQYLCRIYLQLIFWTSRRSQKTRPLQDSVSSLFVHKSKRRLKNLFPSARTGGRLPPPGTPHQAASRIRGRMGTGADVHGRPRPSASVRVSAKWLDGRVLSWGAGAPPL